MTKVSLVDIKNGSQVRTYPYPYTYTFYTIEHALDTHRFEIRYSDIGKGRILVHFDNDNYLIKNREGHMDLRFEPEEDHTIFTMTSAYYSGQVDDDVMTFREELLRVFQFWLDREYSMTLPRYEGDIPRFRPESRGRLLMDRPTKVPHPDSYPVVKQMVFLGASMMISGILINVVLDLIPLYWGMNLAILSGLPFLLFAVMIKQGRLESAMNLYASLGIIAGLVYCLVTVFIGMLIIIFPVAYIYYHVTRIRVWNRYIEDLEGGAADNGTGTRGPPSSIGHRVPPPSVRRDQEERGGDGSTTVVSRC